MVHLLKFFFFFSIYLGFVILLVNQCCLYLYLYLHAKYGTWTGTWTAGTGTGSSSRLREIKHIPTFYPTSIIFDLI